MNHKFCTKKIENENENENKNENENENENKNENKQKNIFLIIYKNELLLI